MAFEYFYHEPDNILCVKVKVPVVLAEEDLQVVVDNIANLPELTKKVDHIDARLNKFVARPIFVHEDGHRWTSVIEEQGWDRFGWKYHDRRFPVVKKILVEGILHKQIYYVNRDDDVRHHGEDIPFASDITLPVPALVVDENDVFVQLHEKRIDMRWKLRGGCRLEQTGVMEFRVKVVEERQIWVHVCPRMDKHCQRGVNILRDGGFEQWAHHTPVFWGADNVTRSDDSFEGSFAAKMGCPARPGEHMMTGDTRQSALFQTVRVTPGFDYRLCFHVRENAGRLAAFNFEAELVFFAVDGVEIKSERQTLVPSQIPDGSYKRFCMESTAPEDAVDAVVRFTFTPVGDNTSRVLVDNVILECIRGKDLFGGYYEERR